MLCGWSFRSGRESPTQLCTIFLHTGLGFRFYCKQVDTNCISSHLSSDNAHHTVSMAPSLGSKDSRSSKAYVLGRFSVIRVLWGEESVAVIGATVCAKHAVFCFGTQQDLQRLCGLQRCKGGSLFVFFVFVSCSTPGERARTDMTSHGMTPNHIMPRTSHDTT